jgi:hypothetical protein
MSVPPTIEGISVVSLVTQDMALAVCFYRAQGFAVRCGSGQASFISSSACAGCLDLIARPVDHQRSKWGRVIIPFSLTGIALAVSNVGLSPVVGSFSESRFLSGQSYCASLCCLQASPREARRNCRGPR